MNLSLLWLIFSSLQLVLTDLKQIGPHAVVNMYEIYVSVLNLDENSTMLDT